MILFCIDCIVGNTAWYYTLRYFTHMVFYFSTYFEYLNENRYSATNAMYHVLILIFHISNFDQSLTTADLP